MEQHGDRHQACPTCHLLLVHLMLFTSSLLSGVTHCGPLRGLERHHFACIQSKGLITRLHYSLTSAAAALHVFEVKALPQDAPCFLSTVRPFLPKAVTFPALNSPLVMHSFTLNHLPNNTDKPYHFNSTKVCIQ